MAAVVTDADVSSAASHSHAAIVYPLLGLLVGVLLIGILSAVFIRQHLQARKAGVGKYADRRSRATTRPATAFRSSIFHHPSRWVAVRSTNSQAVLESLGLHNPTPCSWIEGLSRAEERKLFISPPVNGWVLVIGSLLPEPSDDVDACFRFLHRLSRELGQVQFFSVHRAVGYHAWARFENGRVIRGYAWAGETLWNQGARTRAERKLGLKCYNYCEGAARSQFPQSDRSDTNAEKVPLLASLWSVDPSSVNESALADAFGIAGDLSRARPR